MSRLKAIKIYFFGDFKVEEHFTVGKDEDIKELVENSVGKCKIAHSVNILCNGLSESNLRDNQSWQ